MTYILGIEQNVFATYKATTGTFDTADQKGIIQVGSHFVPVIADMRSRWVLPMQSTAGIAFQPLPKDRAPVAPSSRHQFDLYVPVTNVETGRRIALTGTPLSLRAGVQAMLDIITNAPEHAAGRLPIVEFRDLKPIQRMEAGVAKVYYQPIFAVVGWTPLAGSADVDSSEVELAGSVPEPINPVPEAVVTPQAAVVPEVVNPVVESVEVVPVVEVVPGKPVVAPVITKAASGSVIMPGYTRSKDDLMAEALARSIAAKDVA